MRQPNTLLSDLLLNPFARLMPSNLISRFVKSVNLESRATAKALACCLFMTWLLVGCGKKDGQVPEKIHGLQGTWREILLNDAGKRFITEEEFLQWDSKCTITNELIIWKSGVRKNISILKYTVDTNKSPSWIDWQKDGRSVKGIVAIEGDILKICIGRTRPKDFDPAGSPSENLFVLRKTDAPPVKAESSDSNQLKIAIASFEEAARSGDDSMIDRAIEEYFDLPSSKKSEQVQKFLRHPDQRVRMAAVRLFARPAPEYGKVFFQDSTLVQLIEMVGDRNLSEAERCTIVSAVLQGYESRDRKPLYEKLSQMNADGQFAIPALASFISDKQHRHWSPAGAFDAPAGAVKLLASWGPESAEAVPELIVCLDHPNQWEFAALVAKTLGAIGPKAKEAVPFLKRAQKTNHGKLRQAAREALRKIMTNDENT